MVGVLDGPLGASEGIELSRRRCYNLDGGYVCLYGARACHSYPARCVVLLSTAGSASTIGGCGSAESTSLVSLSPIRSNPPLCGSPVACAFPGSSARELPRILVRSIAYRSPMGVGRVVRFDW